MANELKSSRVKLKLPVKLVYGLPPLYGDGRWLGVFGVGDWICLEWVFGVFLVFGGV